MAMLAVVQALEVSFARRAGEALRVVRGAEFTVAAGESVALVGESGCGKTLSALALVNLLPDGGRIEAGRVEVEGKDVRTLPEQELQRLRGAIVAYVFQDPHSALNPLLRVGTQVAEAGMLRYGWNRRQSNRQSVELLRAVGLENPEALAAAYPHQLSGGQRQRALLAAALSGDPRLLVLDEPTSALDPLAKQQLVKLIDRLQRDRELAMLIITHDFALAAQATRRVVVMYAGETVESGVAGELLKSPLHPYTQALLRCATLSPQKEKGANVGPLATIAGEVPAPTEWGGRCRFVERCFHAMSRCKTAHPALVEVAAGRHVRCFLHADEECASG